ncbi:MAG TPA: M1 family metallopeptidase [Puia sp.]
MIVGKRILLFIFLSCTLQLNAQSYWQQQVNYTIEVSLNNIEYTLDGFVKMEYINHSPDTLSYIWIHCWPNAYKNDRTAFSEQLLANGRTDFYFSGKDRRGYINRLDFHVDGVRARMEDHPQYIDIIKVILPHPLPPGEKILLTTPFHEQLPYNFSRGGHADGAYQVTQWYPKPAVYDSKGWHPIPYLDQGEFYSEFGDYDVRITVPKAYIVAATGELQPDTVMDGSVKTVHYLQKNVHDFAWFADKKFLVDHDTLRLPSGRTIDIYAYYRPAAKPTWQYTTRYIKDAVRFLSTLIGEYPYNVVSAVETKMGSPGGMEYPTITAITNQPTAKALDLLIEHEVGHNWFYAALATNERRYPWMDEGLDTYYDRRYEKMKYPLGTPNPYHLPKTRHIYRLEKKLPEDPDQLFLNMTTAEHQDQPISTSAEDFTASNYDLIVYTKTANWLQLLADSMGLPLFDSCIQTYFQQWQFKHPYPEDFQSIVTRTSRKDWSSVFALLDAKGPLPSLPAHRKIRPTYLFSLRNTDSIDYINFLPVINYNKYDQLMAGIMIHNYNLPFDRFQFLAAPLYSTGAKQLNGIGGVNYNWFPDTHIKKLTLFLWGERFSSLSAIDSNGHKLFGGYYKLTPGIRITLNNPSPRSTTRQYIEWKTFLIGEKGPTGYVTKSTDTIPIPYVKGMGKYDFRYLNQLSFHAEDSRVLYPWQALLQIQQGDRFYRVNFTGNYFFNYSEGGGMDLRLFAAKFGYLGGRSESLAFYQPKLTGVGGNEDYTYSNYFIGRNEYTGFASQQIMQRDGDLKIRVPSFPWLEGRSDNWVSSLNLTSTLPASIVPRWLPLKVFLDVGTYADAWKENTLTSRFLYVGGLQLSLFHDILNFYAPIFYSSDFSDQLKTLPDQNTFWKKISFSIDIQNIHLRKIFSNIPF